MGSRYNLEQDILPTLLTCGFVTAGIKNMEVVEEEKSCTVHVDKYQNLEIHL